MENFVILLRGINVSGKNLVNMKELKAKLLEHFQLVETYIQSENILIQTNDEYHLFENIIYLNCMNGYGKTKLTNNYFEKRLNSKCTTRNWKTILKLNQLLEILYS